jgi:protein-tyrosine phosphatase
MNLSNMGKTVKAARKGIHLFKDRLKNQGVYTTLQWIYGRGIPSLTGIPILRYCRITPQIYVGAQFREKGKELLKREGINAVVNMRIEFDDAAEGLSLDHYCHLPTIDDDAPSIAALTRGVAFIHEIIEQGGKVYIHCAGGVGRAPTMAAAYYISQGMTLEQALGLIRKSRPFINVMPAQMERLYEWQKIYHVENS